MFSGRSALPVTRGAGLAAAVRRGVRAAVVACGVCAGVVVFTPAPAQAATIAADAAAAAAYGSRQGMTSGIAVADSKTGRVYVAGSADREFSSASVVKTLIATRLLLLGRMTGANAASAWTMITRSDNAAATRLYPKVGGDGLLPALARHYAIADLGARPLSPGAWGTTQLTARGLARFYAAVRNDRRVWPWLGRAMHHYARYSSAGEPNAWGIAAAAPSAAVKNGWAILRTARGTWRAAINTTGVVTGDRFAVAILAAGPTSFYYTRGEAIVSRQARMLMPAGVLVPPPTVTGLSPRSGPTAGGTPVTVAGTGFTAVQAVTFGGVAGTHLTVISATKLTVTTPRHVAGTVALRVATSHGTSLPGAYGSFTYRAPSSP